MSLSQFRNLLIALILSLVGLTTLSAPAFVHAAGTACSTSGPTSGAYTVTLCIVAPADGSTVSGVTSVTTSVSVAGTNPGVQRMMFDLNSQYLLTDYSTPYSFSLPTTKFVDGSYLLQAKALMRDGFTTSQAGVNLTFTNGITTPPVNTNTFTPAAGTTPPSGQPFILAASGDGASGEANSANVTNLIAGWNPNMFLYLGDVYEKGSVSEFFNWYSPSTFFGRFNSITNPTVGNHEYTSGKATGYFDYWNNVPNYYSFNAGGWHFISLNSNSQFNQFSTTSPQYQWLSQDLAADTSACTLAYFHHPPFNVGPEGYTTAMMPIWSLLAQNGTTIVLTGHDHDYQRWVPLDGTGTPSSTGITEFVVGTAGHGTQQFVTTDSRLAVGLDKSGATFGALKLALSSNSAAYQFINTAGTVLDSGVITCNPHGNDKKAPSTPTGLTATAGSTPQVNLSWNASTDNVAVTGYTIYRNGVSIGTVNGATLTYADKNIAPSTTYTYSVDAFDAAGNHSAQSSPASATTPSSFTIVPIADAYVNQSNPTSNYGSATVLRVDASPIMNAYIRFNVQGWVPGTFVTLRLYANSSSTIGYDVRGVSDDTWGEKTITFSNAPAISSTITGSSGPFGSGIWTSVDVTSLVTGNGDLNLGVTTTSGTTISFASRESGANVPQLIISSTLTQSAANKAQKIAGSNTPVPPQTKKPTATSTPTKKPAPMPNPTPPAKSNVPGNAGAFTFKSVADAVVNSAAPTTNYGSAKTLSVRGSPDLHSYVEFSVQGVTGTVVKATLRVYANGSSPVGFSVRKVASNTWAESTITFGNAPALPTMIASSAGAFASGGWISVDVTAVVKGNGTYSFALTGSGATLISFASRETGANAPQLIIATK